MCPESFFSIHGIDEQWTLEQLTVNIQACAVSRGLYDANLVNLCRAFSHLPPVRVFGEPCGKPVVPTLPPAWKRSPN